MAETAGVDWYQGSVEEAMKEAKEKNRPMFLYWGAVWCPPCNQIKKTIFSQKAFHAEAKNFISLYLDGDKPNAQKWGEYFKARGYPTMMILDSSGKEITRMPGGLNVSEYVELMTKARQNQKSISELYAKVKANKATLSDYQRLAGYSWGQDTANKETILSEKNSAETFKTIYTNAPNNEKAIKAQFFMRYHNTKLGADKKYVASKKEAEEFFDYLNDSSVVAANTGLFMYYVDNYIKLFQKNTVKKKFDQAYLKAMRNIRQNTSFDLNTRYTSLYPEIKLRSVDKKIPADLEKEVKTWTAKLDRESTDAFSRQSNITTAMWILGVAKLHQQAKELGLKELEKSISPYYIMRYLSSIESKLGNQKKSLEWSKKAWQSSKGGATRFEWGTSYIMSLVKHTPENKKEIKNTTVSVFNELLQNGDAFEGRNKKRLGRLKKTFDEWKKDHNKAFFSLNADLTNNCRKAGSSDLKKRCLGWVKRL